MLLGTISCFQFMLRQERRLQRRGNIINAKSTFSSAVTTMLKDLIEYLVHDLGVQPNVAVTIILSLVTFSLGFVITWTAAAVSKWTKRKNYKKSLKIVIKNFLEACQKQQQLLEVFSTHKG